MSRPLIIAGFSAALALSAALSIASHSNRLEDAGSPTVAHELNDAWMGLNVETETGLLVGYVSDATIDNVNGVDFLRISRFHDKPGNAEGYVYVDLATTKLAADGTRVIVKGYFPDGSRIASYEPKTGLDVIRKRAKQRKRL